MLVLDGVYLQLLREEISGNHLLEFVGQEYWWRKGKQTPVARSV